MSFAQRLSNNMATSRAARLEAEAARRARCRAEVTPFVEEVVRDFMNRCEEASLKECDRAEAIYKKDRLPEEWRFDKEAEGIVVEMLNVKLGRLGFARFQAKWPRSLTVSASWENVAASQPQANPMEGPPLRPMRIMGKRSLTVSASWENVAACQPQANPMEGPPLRPMGAGSTSTCPICQEDRPVVALVPCGHVVCQQCQSSGQLVQCPMCRIRVTGATRGLFFS